MPRKRGISGLLPERRNEIISKEFLTIKDIEELTGCCYDVAARIVREVRNDPESRMRSFSGVIHIDDYIRHYKLNPARFVLNRDEEMLNLFKRLLEALKSDFYTNIENGG